jgi:WD40 repeat protein
MQFSKDGKLLAVASWNGLHLIDVPGLKVLRVLEPEKRFDSVALSPDGKTAATHIQFEEGIRLWHLESGKEIGKIAVTPPPEGILHFSPDGRSLLVQHKSEMYLWEMASGQVRYAAPGTYSQGFSPNGRLIFSIATHLWSVDNKQFFVWDLTGQQTGGVLKPLKHTPQAQADLWADLQSKDDAGKAYRAMWGLAADPEQTVPFLTKKVAAIEPIDPKLTKVEVQPSPPEQILACRIVELLEQIGTPDARRLLETLATPAKPQFTDAARQALARLTGK